LDTPSQFFPDGRIIEEEVLGPLPEEKSLEFDYSINVFTPQDQPAEIVSNLLDGPLSFHMDVKIKDDDRFRGQVFVPEVPLPVIGEARDFEFLRLDFYLPAEDNRLQAQLQVGGADAPITFFLPGRLEQPRNRPMLEPFPRIFQSVIAIAGGIAPEFLAVNTDLGRLPETPDDRDIPSLMTLKRRH
jgi:hypothetical protein